MEQNIFISYRRLDSEGYAGRVYDRLRTCFGNDRVFMDVTDIHVGENFSDAINQAIGSCRVVIVLIGPSWYSITDEMGRKRLDDPHDFVRVEVQAALDQDVFMIPVLVNRAKMPKSEDLPYDLRSLTSYKAIEIRHRRFDSDFEYLIAELEQYLVENIKKDPEALDGKLNRRLLNFTWLVLGLLIVGGLILLVWLGNNSTVPIQSTQSVDSTKIPSIVVEKMSTSDTLTLHLLTETPTEVPTTTPSFSPTNSPTRTVTPTLIPPSTDASLPTKIIDPIGAKMVLVPQGPFTMGTDEQAPWDIISHPSRSVSLDMFYVDMYEVSNDLYAKCVFAGVCRIPSKTGSKMRLSYFDNPEFANHPVVYVSWQDAQTFCSWRGGRLPTEAEWEKAARGDTKLNYPWGENSIDCQHANFWPEDACSGDTTPVDSLTTGASPYGVLNLSGNVQEWVNDWFQAYPGGDPNATREYGISHRVIRGGAYFDAPLNIRATTRGGLNPDLTLSYVGFRCVIDIEALP